MGMDRPPPEHSLAITTSQAARRLGVSLTTVRRWADEGHLSVSRTPGGQRRFSREEIDRFVDSLRQRGGPPQSR